MGAFPVMKEKKKKCLIKVFDLDNFKTFIIRFINSYVTINKKKYTNNY